jgi:alkanesulfonate monooxygenase SsuD/methylene tetrahydromethanopterin reductase-like flavin-dependent oxidoreductase (luciferase family)
VRVGILCSGLGPGADPAFMRTAAQSAEAAGFATIWHGEHVVLFESYPRSKYPYAGTFGGDVPFPDPTTPVVDPVIALTWTAAVTTTIELASGIVILPQRNAVVLAKELATLDHLSGGRVLVGAGLGWCREEYEAIGADWSRRGRTMDEYVEALRRLWRGDAATFYGRECLLRARLRLAEVGSRRRDPDRFRRRERPRTGARRRVG